MATTLRALRTRGATVRPSARSANTTPLRLVDLDASDVGAAADRAVVWWLVASAITVILTVTIGRPEWIHRLLAPGVDLILTVPFFVLLSGRQIRTELRLRLMNLPLLGALQGVMGWQMVQSGPAGPASVSPSQLVIQLGIALVIFAIAAWTAAELLRRKDDAAPRLMSAFEPMHGD